MENKLLFTFIIPAYNGEPFLDLSVHSLVSERVIEESITDHFEIIIINDGSKDKTKEKAESLARKYNKITRKDFIRVINKENGQYGSVINRGIKEAKGTYLKVLDCDDTLNTFALIKTVYIIMSLEKQVDLILTDFTFEKVGTNEKILNSLRKNFEPYKILALNKQKFPKDIMTMHSYIYRVEHLRKIDYKQVEGVYYSDSQYSLLPLAKAKTMYYINLPLYRYYIGRGEQSINIDVMVKNREHVEIVFDSIIKSLNFKGFTSNKVKAYSYIVLRRLIQWQVMLISFDKSVKHKRKMILNLFKKIRKSQPDNYKQIIKGSLFLLLRITRGHLVVPIIKIGSKLYSKFKKNIMAEW